MNLKFNFVKNYFFQSFGVLFLIVISICFANGQSKDIKNPTPLTTNEISGRIDAETRGKIFYYSFLANVGEVNLAFTIERDPNIENGILAAEFFLYDSSSQLIAKKTNSIWFNTPKTAQVNAKIQVVKRQNFVLGIKIYGERNFDGFGTYKLQIDGADVKTKEKTNAESLLSMMSYPPITFPSDGLFTCSLKNESASFSLSFNLVKNISIYDYPKNQAFKSELNYGELTLPSSGKLAVSLKADVGVFVYDLGQISECRIFGK